MCLSQCLTCWLYSPPDNQIDLAIASGTMHQVNDISVWLPHHGNPIYKQQFITGTQTAVDIRWTLLDDCSDQNLLANTHRFIQTKEEAC